MSLSSDSLRIVILDCPYDSWSSPRTQSVFSSMVEMKLSGYKPVYQRGVMPVDSYDFIATHLLVCEEAQAGLRPLTGFKSVTLRQCQKFNLPFPTNMLLKDDTHRQAAADIIESCHCNGKEIAFDSSWTVDPVVRENRKLSKTLQEIFISNVLHWHSPEKHHEVLGTGILRVRTNQFFQRIGFHQVCHGGSPLPPFEQHSLQGASAVLIHFQEGSDYARDLAETYRDIWDNRIIIR